MRWVILIVIVIVLLSNFGCGGNPIMVKKTDNNSFSVDLLFTHDGCKMYRFSDGWENRYFAKCGASGDSHTEWRESCGKNCTHPKEIDTINEK